MQSAYRQNQSTETALLKVKNELLFSNTFSNVIFVLSAACDLIMNYILVDTLQTHFCSTDRALLCVKSYFDGTRQKVEQLGTFFVNGEWACLQPLHPV